MYMGRRMIAHVNVKPVSVQPEYCPHTLSIANIQSAWVIFVDASYNLSKMPPLLKRFIHGKPDRGHRSA
jgi:hypothetical protein